MATLQQLLEAQARLNQQISVLKGQDVDVNKAEQVMQWAVQDQYDAVNQSADQQLKANAMSKGLAQWGAQWLAWKQWATGWQMAAIQAEIDNKFAPQRAQIESQRATAQAAAAWAKANIPTALAGIRAQNIDNAVNLASIPKTSSASSSYRNPIWATADTINIWWNTYLRSQVIDPDTWVWIWWNELFTQLPAPVQAAIWWAAALLDQTPLPWSTYDTTT